MGRADRNDMRSGTPIIRFPRQGVAPSTRWRRGRSLRRGRRWLVIALGAIQVVGATPMAAQPPCPIRLPASDSGPATADSRLRPGQKSFDLASVRIQVTDDFALPPESSDGADAVDPPSLGSAQAEPTPVAPVAIDAPFVPLETPDTVLPPTPQVPGDVFSLATPITDNHGWLDPYRGRVLEIETDATDVTEAPNGQSIPSSDEVHLWWQDALKQPLGMSPRAIPVDVSWLTRTALQSSPLVQSLLTQPKIDQTAVVIADAEFDAAVYLEGKFVDTDEPVGDTLTTGRAFGRYRDETFSADVGMNRQLRGGGTLEAVQRGGFQQNNSDFLVPNPQGTTRLELNYSQPLLKNHGRAVNEISIVLASIDVRLTRGEVRQALEKHLVSVTRAYWDLYQARCEWMQRSRLLRRTEKLHSIVVARQHVDTITRQRLRSEAALAERRTGLSRAEASIGDAQAKLRMLTGSEILQHDVHVELTPQEVPPAVLIPIATRDAAVMALDNRPDLDVAMQRIRSASAKIGVAKNQVLPRLDLLLTGYVAGLDSRRDTWGAFLNQFSDGAPTYAAGLRWELPVGNRAARARLTRNRWEYCRALEEFRQATESVLADVDIATRETKTSYQEMSARYQSILAARREVDYLQQRYERLVEPQQSAIVLIEDLLDAQQRLFNAEKDFVDAQVAYAMSWVELRRSMGVLLRAASNQTDDVDAVQQVDAPEMMSGDVVELTQ